MQRVPPGYWLFGLLMIVQVGFVHDDLWRLRGSLRTSVEPSVTLPSGLLKAAALEHTGLAADIHMLRLMTFYGERFMEGSRLDQEDWRHIERLLAIVTDLDPQFADAYLLGEGLFLYDANDPAAAIRLMEKGRRNRPEDWRMPFYLGANYLLGENNYHLAADYLMEASKLPGSPGFLPNLAARLKYYAGETKVSILFLKGLIEQTSDPALRQQLNLRLEALEGVVVLEKALDEYKKTTGRNTTSLAELTSSGVLEVLPREPYGGEWKILDSGRVYSTSQFALGQNDGLDNP